MQSASPDRSVWRDPRRWHWPMAWLVPLLPWIGVAGYLQGWGGLSLWIGPLVLYGAVPVLDWLLGEDVDNPPPSAMSQLGAAAYYRWLLYLWIPLQYSALLLGGWLIANQTLDPFAWLGLAMSLGLVSSGGINIGHELGHQRSRLERGLAKLALAPACYGHFAVEHNRGHHVRVATPEDPASARLGESFWRFLPRSVFGGLQSAWRLERIRLAGQGRAVLHWRNENLQAWCLSLVLLGLFGLGFGLAAVGLLLVQALIGFSTLEAVNYIEHYGLLRQRGADGRYERCQPCHSWNSNYRLTNVLLYQLQRHSDHHAQPTRRYQTLRHFNDAPQLPAGYATLVPLVYFPPLWFWLMDRRVLAFYAGDRRMANQGFAQLNDLG